MRQGETEGREGALGYRTRRMIREIDEMIKKVRIVEYVGLLVRSKSVNNKMICFKKK